MIYNPHRGWIEYPDKIIQENIQITPFDANDIQVISYALKQAQKNISINHNRNDRNFVFEKYQRVLDKIEMLQTND